MEGITKYRPASFSRDNYVQLEDGSFVLISEIRVKGRTGLSGIPTEKELKNPKTEFTNSSSRKVLKLKSRQVYERYEQTSFVVFSSAKGSSSVRDKAMLSTSIFDVAAEKTYIPVTIDDYSKDLVVPLSSISASLSDGSTRAGLDVSNLISLMGDKATSFQLLNEDGTTTNLHFDADFLTKIRDVEEGFVPAKVNVPKVEKFVTPDKIFEVLGDRTTKTSSVESVSELITLLGSGSKDFRILNDDGMYYDLAPFTADMLKNVKYECGRYVLVRLKGDSAHTVCPIENLRLDDGHGNPKNEKLSPKDLYGCVGKKIWALGEDGKTPYELEPLTEDEIVPFESRKFYRETVLDSDICKDETDPSKPQSTAMLRLKNGKYVKEADVVQPKCYNFVDDPTTTVYDAYVVTLSKGTVSERSYVIDKSKIDSATSDKIRLAVGTVNIEFNKAEAQKVVKSHGGINNSDIVQTTSTRGARAEKCEVLNTRKDNVKLLDGTLDTEQKQQLAERIKKIYAEFLEKYKSKQYDLGGELLIMDNPKTDGEFFEYLENHRYMLSDIIPMEDSATNNLKELLNMPDSGFTFDGEKLVGGAKYDYKKGVINSFSKWGEGMAYALGFTFSAGGALVSLVSPFLLVGLAAGMVGWGIGVPIYHAIKKRKVESKKNYEYKNKIEYQSKKTKDNVFAQLEKIIEDFKDKQPEFEKSLAGLSPEAKAQKIEERKQLLLADIALQETKIDLLSSSKSGAQFDMIDGKGKVTQANAHEYSKYVKLLGERKTEIENLSKEINTTAERIKKLEGAKSLTASQRAELSDLRVQRQEAIDLLAVKNNEFQNIRKTYRITGEDNNPDKEQQVIRDRIDQAKGFMMVKYFGESVFDKEDKDLTPAEKAQKIQIQEYVRATEIIVDRHKRDFEYVRELTKDKTKKVSRRAWKKQNKAIKVGGLFAKLRQKGKLSKSAEASVSTASAIEAISTMHAGSEAEVEAEVAPELAAEAEHTVAPDEVASEVSHDVTPAAPERKKAKTSTTKRSLAGLTKLDVEKIIIEVCRAMEELNKITDAFYGDGDLIGGEEERAKKLTELYEYNENVLKAVLKNPPAKKYMSLHTKYSSKITEAAKRYKDYIIYVANKNVKAL